MNFKAISRTQDQVSVGPTTSRSNGGANTYASADGGDAFSSGQVSPPADSNGFAGTSVIDGRSQSERVLAHVVAALHGFFRSITLGSSDSIQDLLRLLTLWFRYGGEPEVEQALLDGFDTVDIDMWLHVLPQIIARISSPTPRLRACVQQLLLRVGRKHPQALIYPLAVASHEARGQQRQQQGERRRRHG